jgi:hypothetical protein
VAWTFHGFLYIIYLVTAVDLARRARFTLGQMVAMVCAGFVPFLAFYIEARVARRIEPMLVAADSANDAAASDAAAATPDGGPTTPGVR